MITLTRERLERPSEETVRHLALALLSAAEKALERMKQEDAEALHDFRVALRRLRSTMRAYRPYLRGSARKKLRSRLKALASSTNAFRDAEVQIAYLVREGGTFPEHARAGAERVAERLRSSGNARPDHALLQKDFHGLEKALRKSLSRMRLNFHEDTPSFLSATGGLVKEHAEALKNALGAVKSEEDGAELHTARIEAKRLRYLLEPLGREIRRTRSLVKKMKSLQDCLGELQDTRVLMETISSALEEAALEQARRLRDSALGGASAVVPETAGPPPASNQELLELLKAQRDRRDRLFRELSRNWLGDSGSAFFDELRRTAERLEGASSKPELKRRFLLKSVPERARARGYQHILEGFLPGRDIRESVRAVREGRRIRYLRLVQADGSSQEEPVPRKDFQRFLRLAAGSRLERDHYEVEAEGVLWKIDDFGDLVVSEASAPADFELPDWIRNELIREVTGSTRYELRSIAQRS